MTAIFDIGKTNKKLFVFDDELKIVYEKSQQFSEIKDEDGFPCEDVKALTDWMKSSFDELIANPTFNIQKVNFSGYGASFIHLGRDGKPVTPLYNYLKPYPEKLKEKFYQQYGLEQQIAQETASPTLGNLNSGMQLYWLKYERPDVFKEIAISLHLPQYLSSIFTQHYLSDITSIGCHTQLWNFKKNGYHNWVIEEQIDQVLAPITHSDLLLSTVIQNKTIGFGIGLHDSSAALIPYLKNFNESFVLISTGTWCISLNPFNDEPLTADELRQDCLCYLAYQGKPVKASRLFSGQEHDIQVKHLSTYFNKSENYYSTVKFNPDLVRSESKNALETYKTFEEAYHALIDSLVNAQVHSTQLIVGRKPVHSIFVDGGFSKNEIFMNLLAKGFSKRKVFSSDVAQASALGTALAINHESEKNLSKNFTLRQFHPA